MSESTAESRRFEFLSSRYLRLGLGLVISGTCLYLALRNVSYFDAATVLKTANLWYVGLALVSVATNTVAKAARWQVLMATRATGLKFPTVIQALMAGQTLNTLFPARLGDLGRVYAIRRLGPEPAFVLGTIFLEKLLDMISYAALFVVVLLLIRLPAWVSHSAYTVAGGTAAIVILVGVVTYRRHWLSDHFGRGSAWVPQRWHARTARHLQAALSSLAILESRGDVLQLVIWSAIVWATAILNNQLALLALQMQLPLTTAALLLIVLQAGVSIPSVPAGLGLFEYLCVLTLAVYGVQKSAAFTYGVLLHLIVFLPSTLIGLACIWKLGLTNRGRIQAAASAACSPSR